MNKWIFTLILAIVAIGSCITSREDYEELYRFSRIQIAELSRERDSLVVEIEILRDSLSVADSLLERKGVEEWGESMKLERIEEYVRLCEKNSNNTKFLLGWIKRVIEE